MIPPGGWIDAGTPRVTPLPPAELPWFARLVSWGARRWGRRHTANAEIPALFLMLLRHRRLFWPWLRFAARLMPNGSIGRREAELVILRVAWTCRCRYEWGQHAAIALRLGFTPAEIRRVAEGPEAEGWQPKQSALLRAVDELHRDRVVSAVTWGRLAAVYDQRQLIEVVMLAGHYEMLAGVLNTTALPLDATVERALAGQDLV
ncbi:carboxymuconolactone decarboxylase family protein [Zavarzinia compransoris]|uniref:carboxymuconolactone decarboxylase family protein n=1 Tax=Zavarzinia compransoris TaxID=1264899 RepID=UPI0010F315D8|nr:carboxymuconolactone decarboxylase family protein [Zavarzinia compransoris]TDP45462.1 alkylhydroperoxidase family enzyme [Zavarzinia compransoris]